MTIVLGIDIKVDRNSLKKVLVEKLKQLHICLTNSSHELRQHKG